MRMVTKPVQFIKKTVLPVILRNWGKTQNLAQHRWIQIIEADYDATSDTFDVCGRRFPCVLESGSRRFYVAVASPTDAFPDTCYWLGINLSSPTVSGDDRPSATPLSGGYHCSTIHRERTLERFQEKPTPDKSMAKEGKGNLPWD